MRDPADYQNQDLEWRTDKYLELIGRCRLEIHRRLGPVLPELAIVLGSGFQDVVDGFTVAESVSYRDLPGFPEPSVMGHSGSLLLAEIEGLRCLVCSGRAHFYEGYTMGAVMLPVRILARCGVKELILTNAAGGINPRYQPGDFMLFRDHINFSGVNPLREGGLNGAERFVDLTRAYCGDLRRELRTAAARANVRARLGVYLGVSGPSYETPAEIRAYRKLGADAVGMSTIPEVLIARALGLRVAALSCITNAAAGMRRKELSHGEVLERGRQSAGGALRLFFEFARERAKEKEATHLKSEPRRKNLKNNERLVGSRAKKR